jgi:catechol 2,3-dioxygenase-like lactoylglutathione lyase family enzyme
MFDHVKFGVSDYAASKAFFQAALAPLRVVVLLPNYHASYYAAFVIGPDGRNIEAVCHAPA